MQDVVDQSERLGRTTLCTTSSGEKLRIGNDNLIKMGFVYDGLYYVYDEKTSIIKVLFTQKGCSVTITTPTRHFDISCMFFIDDLMRCAESCGINLRYI